jgi:hypothetical protein
MFELTSGVNGFGFDRKLGTSNCARWKSGENDEIEKYLVNHMKNTIVSSKPSGHE